MKTSILKNKNYWLSDTFKEKILGDIKEVPEVKYEVIPHVLTEYTHDDTIREQIGIMTKEECLALLIYLTSKQPNGEGGVLLTNGYSNIIGYVQTDESVLAVYGFWRSDGRQWRCHGYEPSGWSDGSQFLSRNGVSKTLKPKDPLNSDTLTLPNEQIEKVLVDILVKLHTIKVFDGMENDGEYCNGFYEGLRQARHIIKEKLLEK